MARRLYTVVLSLIGKGMIMITSYFTEEHKFAAWGEYLPSALPYQTIYAWIKRWADESFLGMPIIENANIIMA